MTAIFDSSLLPLAAQLLLRVTALVTIAHFVLWWMRGRSAAANEMLGRWFLIALCLLPLVTLSGLSIGVFPVPEESLALATSFQPQPFEHTSPMPTSHPAEETSIVHSIARWAIVGWAAIATLLIVRSLATHVLIGPRLFARGADELSAELRERLGITDRRLGLAVVSRRATQPVVAGILRPRIALPPAFLEWQPDRQAAVLAHELAHVERRDGVAVLLRQLTHALWWPHPLVRSLSRRVSLLCEQACDDRVLEQGIDAAAYANALIDITRSLKTSASRSPALAMTTTSQLEARVHALLAPARQRDQPRIRGRLAAASAALSLGLLCAAGTGVAQGEAPPPSPPPETRSEPVPPAKLVEIRFAVTKAKRIIHAGRDIGMAGVSPVIRRLCQKSPCKVVIQCAKEVPAKLLVLVIDRAKQGGANDIAIATVDAATPPEPSEANPSVRKRQPTPPPIAKDSIQQLIQQLAIKRRAAATATKEPTSCSHACESTRA